MHRSHVLLLALTVSACARQRVSAPVAAAPGPRVVQAGVAPVAVGGAAVSGTEAVNYILARGMAIPVAGMTVGQLEDTFDEGRSSGRIHRALDILAPRGTPVVAADSGRILRISVNALGSSCGASAFFLEAEMCTTRYPPELGCVAPVRLPWRSMAMTV